MICKLCPRPVGPKGCKPKQLCWIHYIKSKPGWEKRAKERKRKRTALQMVSDIKKTKIYKITNDQTNHRERLIKQLKKDKYL